MLMIKIAYYISDYGYGHASRSLAVIRQLLINNTGIQVVICHSFALEFLKKSLHEFSKRQIQYRVVETDIGYFTKRKSIELDVLLLEQSFETYMEQWPRKVIVESQFLKREKIDLVISDISPLAFEAAAQLNVPSVGISNFTWFTAYQGLIEETKLKIFQKAYEKMSYFFSLAGNQERTWNKYSNLSFQFFSRPIDETEVVHLKRWLNPDGEKIIIFFGLGMKMSGINLEQLHIWGEEKYVFVVSSNMEIEHPNVFRIPDNYLETQNFIAAADLAITKAGWGIVSEAIIGRTPLLILNRQSMREDQAMIHFLKSRKLCSLIEWKELLHMKSSETIIDQVCSESLEGFLLFENEIERLVSQINLVIERTINQ